MLCCCFRRLSKGEVDESDTSSSVGLDDTPVVTGLKVENKLLNRALKKALAREHELMAREREAVAALSWLEGLGYACVPCNGHQSAFALVDPWPTARYVERFRNTSHFDDIVCRPRETLRCVPPPWRWDVRRRRNRTELDNLVCNTNRKM